MAQTRQGCQPGHEKTRRSFATKVPPARSARDISVPRRLSGEIAALQALGSGIFCSVLEFELALFGHALKCFTGIFDPVLVVIAIRRQQPHHLVRPARARARDGARRKQDGLTDPKPVRAQHRGTRLKVVRDRCHGSDRNRPVRLGFCRNLTRNGLTNHGIAAGGPSSLKVYSWNSTISLNVCLEQKYSTGTPEMPRSLGRRVALVEMP